MMESPHLEDLDYYKHRPISHLLRNVRGRSPRNAKNNSDLSELPLSHVKLMRKKLLRSINIDKKGDINKKCFRKKKLKGTAKIMRQKEKVRSQLSDLTAESEQKTSSSIVKSEADVPSSSLLSSVTVFDADVARPSRPIHRPVRDHLLLHGARKTQRANSRTRAKS